MNREELLMLQSLPLELKIAKTKLRIEEFVRYFGKENVYVSFSGGKDSTVLEHIVRSIYGFEIPLLFSNTGLEFPEVVDNAKYVRITVDEFLKYQKDINFKKLLSLNKLTEEQFHHILLNDRNFIFKIERPNIVIVRPEKTFKQVLEEDGYPVLSKINSWKIEQVRKPTSKNKKTRILRLHDYMRNPDGTYSNTPNDMGIPKKWRYLVEAPFNVSAKCCGNFKKKPFSKYEKETGRRPIIGTMADESRARKDSYLRKGCNTFDEKKGASTPLGFWTEQDILKYIKEFNVYIPSVYGDIVEDENGKLSTTGEKRTGCVFCMYGLQLEKGENRFQRLERTHPNLHKACIEKLNLKDVCDYMNIPYSNNMPEKKSEIWLEGEKKRKEWLDNPKEKFDYFTRDIE